MINFITGNILESNADAIVNPVNCEGYMGKGLAYQIKKQYPKTYEDYSVACKQGRLKIGQIHCFKENEKMIINFPTKDKWRAKSKISYITDALQQLIHLLRDSNIKSIAIPPLGCGLGGLNWEEVKQILLEYLEPIACTLDIYINLFSDICIRLLSKQNL